ncbi:MAG: zinc ribbon domain-containing protein [Clostridia bacterium]|nr:zinc ribbon domain-containing protein [Clostridia bacterium]
MNCSKCNATLPDEATFCSTCGARVDGKVNCPKCNAAIPENSKFCTVCGTRVDGKTACANCGAEYEGNFCPNCGKGSESVEKAKEKSDLWEKAKNILKIVSGASVVAAAAFAFIFVFLIGFRISSNSVDVPTNSLGGEHFIYYFFGNVYKDAKELIAATSNILGSVRAAIYLNAVLSTLFAAATIICVTVFAALAITNYVKNLTGKSEKPFVKWAMFAAFSYFVGLAALSLLNGAAISYEYSTTGMNMNLSANLAFNGATVAGLVLCIISLAVYVIAHVATKGKELLRDNVIAKYAFALVSFAFSLVVLCLVVNWGASFTFEQSSMKINMSYAFLDGFVSFNNIGSNSSELKVTFVFALLSTLTTIVTLLLSAKNLLRKYCNITQEGKNGLSTEIVIVILAVVSLVFTIVYSVLTTDLNSSEISASYAVPIVTVVFAVVNLVVAIVQKILNRNSQKN